MRLGRIATALRPQNAPIGDEDISITCRCGLAQTLDEASYFEDTLGATYRCLECKLEIASTFRRPDGAFAYSLPFGGSVNAERGEEERGR